MKIELSAEEIEMLLSGLGWKYSEGAVDSVDAELYNQLVEKLRTAAAEEKAKT